MGPCSRAPLTLNELTRKFAALGESVSVECAARIEDKEKTAQALREIRKQLAEIKTQLAALRRGADGVLVDDLITNVQRSGAPAPVDVIMNRCE